MPQFQSEGQLEWERRCPESITSDVLWKLDVYRAALYFQHAARGDCKRLRAAHHDEDTLRQLSQAAGSIGANLSEGYSRSTGADRLRFLTYALGSARECVPWYQAVRDAVPDDVIDERLRLVARIRSLLLGMIRSIRRTRPSKNDFEP